MAPTNKKVSNYIPDEIAFTILSKLPLKSLKRFTCARKSWPLLFENSQFVSMFRNSLISKCHSFYDDTCLLLHQIMGGDDNLCQLYLLSGEGFENKVKLDWPPPFHIQQNDGIHILGSVINDTLCFYKNDHTTDVLWNLATEEFKVIPPGLAESLPDITTEFTLHGFGYDHVRDDYKVIQRVSYYPTNFQDYWVPIDFEDYQPDVPMTPDPFWEIYSLRSNSWRILDVNMPSRCMSPLSPACAEVYLNGVCHWWGKTNDEIYVVSFNLSNEVFFTTPLPLDMHDSFDSKRLAIYLVVLNGCVAMISNYAKTSSFHISILGELGVKESWIKLFDVEHLSCVEHPIGVGKKGDIFFRKEDDELACFDLTTGVIKEIGIKGMFLSCQIVIYKKTVLPTRGLNN